MQSKRVAVIRLSALGDILHTLAAVNLLSQRNNEVVWFVEPAGAKLLENFKKSFKVKEVRFKGRGLKDIFKEIRNIRKEFKGYFDIVYDFQGLIKSAVLSKLLGGKTIGFNKKSVREPLASLFYKKKVHWEEDYKRHVVFKNFSLIGACKEKLREEDIFNYRTIIKPLSSKLEKFIKENGIDLSKSVLINVGGGWESKRLKSKQFIYITENINKKGLIPLVIWGNNQEKELACNITKVVKSAYLMPFLDFDELISLINSSLVTISSDSLALHLADSCKKASIAYFGPTSCIRNGSLLKESISVSVNNKKKFTYKRKNKSESCLDLLDLDLIVDSCLDFYQGKIKEENKKNNNI